MRKDRLQVGSLTFVNGTGYMPGKEHWNKRIAGAGLVTLMRHTCDDTWIAVIDWPERAYGNQRKSAKSALRSLLSVLNKKRGRLESACKSLRRI
jgi:hypothetical protein